MNTSNEESSNKLTALNILTGWLKQLSIAVLYLILGIIIHRYFTNNAVVSAVWPGSGLALAALLIGGKHYIWGILFGALLLNIHAIDSLWTACGVTLASIIEVLLGVWLLRNNQPALYLHTLADYLRLILLGGVVASIVGAIIGTLSLLLTDVITPAKYFRNALCWWMGDTLGVILVTPFILAVWQAKYSQFSTQQMLEGTLLIGITFIAGQIVFFGWFNESFIIGPKAFMMFFFITLVAIRMGDCGATFVALMIATQALWGASLETDYFAHDIARTGLHNYWLYMLILSLIGMTTTTYVNTIKETLATLQLKDSALNAAANAIIITDIDGRIKWANQAFSRLTGFGLN